MRALVLVALLALSTAAPTFGKTTTACWFEGGWLYATGLPTTYPYSVTSEPIPTGTTDWSVDGTLAVETWATSAWFWTRKGGGGLFKPGPGLNDYKPIAECHA